MFLGFRWVVGVGGEGLSGFCAISATFGKGSYFVVNLIS